jgi:glutamate carboxypeptidase
MIQAIDASATSDIALLEKIVNINSGTINIAGVLKVKDVLEPQIQALGFTTTWHPMDQIDGRAGDLVAEHPCALGKGKCGKHILLIGHMDTVFEPTSTFQTYAVVPGTNGRVATGPGVADMKGGLVVMLSALRAMKAAGALDKAEITIVLDGEEENQREPAGPDRGRQA